MKTIALLVLACSCYLCEPQTNGNGDQLTGNCDLFSLPFKVTNMAEKIALLEAKLQNTEKEIKELRSLTTGTPRVAFSATLKESGSGDTGPFTAAVPLQYKKVYSNTGSCYNPSTGIFTAQVKGMYYFRFSMFTNLSKPNSVVSLKKNDERLTSVWDTSSSDINDMGSNAVVIALEVGDSVYVELMANRIVYDDSMHYNTFSGFLLFTM
ncbi:complement C1q-like protein 2 isoform X1 [Alosa sapidissima]|uniref:complement C1q-like protein 2 isoform X1 n=1 Tax=Alosa sapidissima TaxID=34773 RepID=UPI001C081BAF|nr:complement C1q-like protein 2 isoform X1 [Alosa sapidissima]